MFTNSFIYHHLFVFAWIETRLECNEINVTSVSFTYVMYWNMKTNVTTCGNMFTNVVNMYFFFFCSQPGLRYFCVCIGHSNLVPVRVGTKILFKKANFQCLIHIRRAISAAEIQMEEAWTSSIWKRRRRGRKTLPVAVATTWGTSKLVSNLCSRRYSIKF